MQMKSWEALVSGFHHHQEEALELSCSSREGKDPRRE